METTTIRHDLTDGVLVVTLDRPDQLNAFTVTMADELEETFIRANSDDSIRAIVVTGAGRAFCAGMDLNGEGNVFGLDASKSPTLADMADLDDPELRDVRDTGGRVALAVHDCAKPVIAAINGPAIGIGATMTLAMDIRLISTDARFGLVFGRLGIVPEAASSWFLPRIVGLPTALDLVYRADIIDASKATELGIAHATHNPEVLLDRALELAHAWTKDRSPVATALTRQMMRRNSALLRPEDAHRVDSLAMFYTSTSDGAEGVRAFREKRTPEFHGKASEMPAFYEEWLGMEQ